MPPDHTSGSYVGWLAIATTRPVRASRTTAAPLSAAYLRWVTVSVVSRAVLIVSWSCFSTSAWTLASIEVTRVSPGVESISPESPSTRPIESTATCRYPGCPRSQASYAFSTPARPTTEAPLTEVSSSFSATSSSPSVMGLR